MKKYVDINSSINWRKLLPLVQNENVVLLNKPNNEFILAWGSMNRITVNGNHYDADRVQHFIDTYPRDYILGYFAYDLKNNETRNSYLTESIDSENDLFLVVPEHVIIKTTKSNLYFGSSTLQFINQFISDSESKSDADQKSPSLELKAQTKKETYLNDILNIKAQIQNGIIYEMNYCVNFRNQFEQFSPVDTYIKLTNIADAPFSAFVNDGQNYILSASPERFLNKRNELLTSQPIKGTAKRGSNAEKDLEIKKQLAADPKELSENVMIVDLVRNDLAKVAKKKSVRVEELCQPYTFKTVHQLISTISCQLRPNISFTDMLQALFPMGSMTGAPKISAISNINQFESFRRGIYSGAIGYIAPNGNFDFNVVIRSILANMATKQISCGVGGAITINSDPNKEYEECLLKLKAIQNALC